MINGIKVSVIIPIYNVEKYIRKALDSVVNQTLKDIEIICVNDCTPDNSMLIVEEFAKNDERFVIINQETNQGQGVARNRAIDVASGEYIMFLDPDDWFELDACEKAYNQISKNQNEMVFFNLYSWKERKGKLGKRILNTTRLKPFEEVKDNPHINLRELNTNWILGGWTLVQIYSREFLNNFQIRYTARRYAEDLSFIIKAMICSKNISVLNEPLYNYRKRESSSTVYTDYYKDVIETKKEAYEILCEFNAYKGILNNFLLYEIASNNSHFKKYAKVNKNIRNDFYLKLKSRFKEILEIISEDVLKKSHVYKDFNLILECKSYEEYRIKRVLGKILYKKKNCINEKIDLIYTWVDSSDINWQKRKILTKSLDNFSKEATNPCRFINNDELIYSLRSVEKNASWINHIYIITDKQTPQWLNINHPKITIVDHSEILPKNALPTFNSRAIELCMVNIPNLSEKFLYANDDMLIRKQISPEFFFTSEGKPIYRVYGKIEKSINSVYCESLSYLEEILYNKFKKRYNRLPHHNIDPYTKSLIKECYNEFKDLIDGSIIQKFRTRTCIQRFIYNYYACAKNKARYKILHKLDTDLPLNEYIWKKINKKEQKESIYIGLDDISRAEKILDKMDPTLFCINDNELAADQDRERLKQFLDNLYPQKSSFEK